VLIKEAFIMDARELGKLAVALEKIENDTLATCGLQKISGSFAKATMFDFDENYIDIELISGVQSDCTNETVSDTIKLDRRTFEEV
jgi:hypothetical protein